ncbi:MAG: SUMF1/EgtB/PvdO family nonheme iron enzyme [Microcystaceae cyanobacterium]
MTDNNRLPQREKTSQHIIKIIKQYAPLSGMGIGITAIIGFIKAGQPQAAIISATLTFSIPILAIAWNSLTRFKDKLLDEIEKELEGAEDKMVKGLVKVGKTFLTKARWQLNPKFQQDYYESLVDTLCDVSVDGFRLGASALNLEDIFISLRIIPKSSEQISGHLLSPHDVPESQEIWDILAKSINKEFRHYRRIAIIGAPGSGKTTLLKHLALSYANKSYKRVGAPQFIPILLYLRDIRHLILQDNPLTLPKLIQQSIETLPSDPALSLPQGWIEDQLRIGNCLILLDGLDEVANATEREQVSLWVNEQMRIYRKTHFIVTSRPHGYDKQNFERIGTDLAVLPFSPSQTDEFIHRLYTQNKIKEKGRKTPAVFRDAEDLAKDLIDKIKKNRAIADMAKNPLLITMIATVHYNGEALPGRRVELYQQICDLLLGKRQAAKKTREKQTTKRLGIPSSLQTIENALSAEQNKSVLQVLALSLMEAKSREFTLSSDPSINPKIPRAIPIIEDILGKVAPNSLSPQDFFETIQFVCGLIVEREVGIYEFAHLSFQEYLAAAQIQTLKQEKPEKFDLLLENFEISWWSETIRLYSAQSDATPLIQHAIDNPTIKSLTLALDCQQEKLILDSNVDEALNKLLEDGLDSDNPEIAQLAAEVKLSRRLTNLLEIDEKLEIDLNYLTVAEYKLFLDDIYSPSSAKSHFLLSFQAIADSPPHHPRVKSSTQDSLELPLLNYSEVRRNPITELTLDDALNFCSWLNQKAIALTGQEKTSSDNTFYYRLPNAQEAQNYPPNEHPHLQCWIMEDYENPSLQPKSVRLIKTNIPSLFSFETVKVNRQGQIIDKQRLTRQYFSVPLNSPSSQGGLGGISPIELDMVLIPSGTFWMGTPDEEIERLCQKYDAEWFKWESPQHQVTLDSFYLSKYPITQAQWRAIAAQTNLKVNIDLDPNPSKFKGDNRPVEQVNWDEAVEFCQRLSKLTGKAYQLPSEAQWEYACRSAPIQNSKLKIKNDETVGAQGLRPTSELTLEEWNNHYHQPFHFGETITPDIVNYRPEDWEYKGKTRSGIYAEEPKGKYRKETTPVGNFHPNAFGVYDMHGNVWEWCADQWHSNYHGAPDDGSVWGKNISSISNSQLNILVRWLNRLRHQDNQSNRLVVRCGSWGNNPYGCRSAYRNFNSRDGRLCNFGFRVMCAVGKTL